MEDPLPTNEALRRKGRVIDQRQQQIDPAGRDRVDQNDGASKRTQESPRETAHDRKEPDDAE